MIKNYLKIAFRTLLRQKMYSAINILGLALGMACFLLILLWVQDELSYDRFHENADRLYRITAEWKEPALKSARTPGRLAPAILAEIPEIEAATRVMPGTKSAFRYRDRAFYEEKIAYVDPAFFAMFSFALRGGQHADVLKNAGSMVITERAAQKYFGEAEPAGAALNWNNWADLTVTGVLQNMPANSHLQYDFLRSHAGVERNWPGGYTWRNFVHETYVLVHENADVALLARKISELYFQHAPEMAAYVDKFSLQPLTDIYLNSEIQGSHAKMGDQRYVFIFSIVAAFVLLIACINFVNLSTARSMQRAREVGLRKVIGARRRQLVVQFLSESVLLAVLAFCGALLAVEIAMPFFNQLTDKTLSIYSLRDTAWWFLAIIFCTGVVAGFYPALYLSAVKPVKAFGKSNLSVAGGKVSLRSVLVVTQFALSTLLIVSAFFVHRQLAFMRTQNLGFEQANIIYVPTKGAFATDFESVKQALQQHPAIAAVSVRSSLPMIDVNNSTVDWPGKQAELEVVMENSAVGYDFFTLLNMPFVAGRNFSRAHGSDATEAFVVNETAARLIGGDDILGKQLSLQGKHGRVVGVVQDAHFKSLHHRIHPQVFYLAEREQAELMDLYGAMLIKVAPARVSEAIEATRHVWRQFNPDVPFVYHFLDETIAGQYQFEQKISAIVDGFTVFAVLISCLGLFGLAVFTAEQRTKEIGIRKVLGASVASVVNLLSKDFVKLVLVANLIAWPVAWYAANKWLQNFAYRIDVGLWVFVLAGGLALLIALLTVSTQAIRAALANPVESLRCE